MFTARIAARRLPRALMTPKRFYSEDAGSVAKSKGFNKKEQAHENEYARRHEAEQLAKMRANIEQKKTELEQLEKEHAAELAKAGKQ
ncbi:unnamed protein product [Mycena citricolor]|uniref:ATPase inhibitor, mitochondrial n=1 Tax=Mycena citricolor TaxID=2018698 RepID=A0AAD2H8G0_9AGAR|nr:unnamed protein product [Mycena citricolor]